MPYRAELGVALLATCLSCVGDGALPRATPAASPYGTAQSAVQPSASVADAPALPPAKRHEVRIEVFLRPKGKTKRTFWLYRPEPVPEKLALVLIAPAGGNMLSGRALSSDDRPEHMPYARAGFAVMAYSLDGDLPPGVSNAAATQAIKDYQASKAGLENASAAIDLALKKMPSIDPSLIFAAGHGSAGAHALLLAAEEPRVSGAVVYAPVTRLVGDVGAVVAVDKVIPGYAKFVRWSIPENRVHDIVAPLFIYQSKEDEVVRATYTKAYVDRLVAAKKALDYVEVPLGDHQEGMLQDGIPRGLGWLRGKRGD